MARMNLSSYKFQGKDLTVFQKAYNKAVSLAWRRIKYMNKKYGISAQLPAVPATTDDDEIAEAIKRLENIRTDVFSDPKKRRDYIDKFIQDFINDVTDYMRYVDQSSKYEVVNIRNRQIARKWAETIELAINGERGRRGDEAFYSYISQPDITRSLKVLAQEIYSLPSHDSTESAATNLFNKFITILRGEAMDINEMFRDMTSMPEENTFDPYQNLVDIDTADEMNDYILE